MSSSAASAPTTAPAVSEWEAVYQALPTVAEGWATSKAVAEVTDLKASIVTRRLQVLEESGRVESSVDKAVTGTRGRVWRQRKDGPRVLGPIETVQLPAHDVDPDPSPDSPTATDDPDARACEKCGADIHPTEAEAGYTRCAACDPDGEHTAGTRPAKFPEQVPTPIVNTGHPAEMSDDEANEAFGGLPTSMIAGEEPACRVCGCTENAACPGGCCWVPDPTMQGELCSSCAVPVDDEDGDPSPVSPAPTGSDVAAIADWMTSQRTADPLSADDARALTDRIRIQVSDLLPLIKEAYNRRAHISLGYESWAAYCDTELRGLRMPLAERQAATAELRAEGLSTRAIAGALGSSDATVRRDLQATGATDDAPERATGLDGRSYPTRKPKTAVDGDATTAPSADGAEDVTDPSVEAPAGDGRIPSPAVPGNPPAAGALRVRAHAWQLMHTSAEVWIATLRKGVEYHRPANDRSLTGPTACDRSTRTGGRLSVFNAEDRYDATPCPRCWSDDAMWQDASPGDTPGQLVPGEADAPQPVDGYEPDPAVRIAAVAEMAPAYVQPVEPSTSDATDSQAGDVTAAQVAGGDVRADRPGTEHPALVGEVLPAPRRVAPDPAYVASVAGLVRALGAAIDDLEHITWDDGPGGPLTLPDLKHERRRLDKLIGHLQKTAA